MDYFDVMLSDLEEALEQGWLTEEEFEFECGFLRICEQTHKETEAEENKRNYN